MAKTIPPPHITSRLFKYSVDAKAGTASVRFWPNPVDDSSVFVTIRYAEGVTEQTGMLNMVAMGSPSTWRMEIGPPGQ